MVLNQGGLIVKQTIKVLFFFDWLRKKRTLKMPKMALVAEMEVADWYCLNTWKHIDILRLGSGPHIYRMCIWVGDHTNVQNNFITHCMSFSILMHYSTAFDNARTIRNAISMYRVLIYCNRDFYFFFTKKFAFPWVHKTMRKHAISKKVKWSCVCRLFFTQSQLLMILRNKTWQRKPTNISTTQTSFYFRCTCCPPPTTSGSWAHINSHMHNNFGMGKSSTSAERIYK